MSMVTETVRNLTEVSPTVYFNVPAGFAALLPFLDPTNSKKLPSYEEVADQLQVSLGGVKTLIHRLRKRYSEVLREEVARTVTDPRAVDDEIHALCEALIASEGRLGP